VDVAGGLGDIAVGNLTVTEERLRVVDFLSDPDAPAVNEIVVTGPGSPAIGTADDLGGKTDHVRRASSYFERPRSAECAPRDDRGTSRERRPRA
jgi:ABC-type amino acid transport substrate-binding protein